MSKTQKQQQVSVIKATVKDQQSVSIQKDSSQVIKEIEASGLIPHPVNKKALKQISNSYHQKALNFKAVASVGLGYTLTDLKGEPVEEIPEVLLQANPLESFHEVLISAALDFEETGDGYLEVVRSAKGIPTEMYWSPSETVYINKEKTEFTQKVNEKKALFVPYGAKRTKGKNQGEMIRFKYPSNRSTFYGTPDWLGAVGPIALDAAAVEWNYRFFENNAIPAYAIIVEGGEFDEDVEAAIKDFLVQNVKGLENSHKTLYLPIQDKEVKVRFEKISADMKDADFQKLRTQVRDEVLSAHGVPPRIMGVVTSGSMGGGGEAEQQLKIFKEVSVAPKQKLFESVLNRTILKDLGLQIHLNSIDVSPQKDDIQQIKDLVQATILTPEEGRDALDIPGLMKSEKEGGLEILKQVVLLRSLLRQNVA